MQLYSKFSEQRNTYIPLWPLGRMARKSHPKFPTSAEKNEKCSFWKFKPSKQRQCYLLTVSVTLARPYGVRAVSLVTPSVKGNIPKGLYATALWLAVAINANSKFKHLSRVYTTTASSKIGAITLSSVIFSAWVGRRDNI